MERLKVFGLENRKSEICCDERQELLATFGDTKVARRRHIIKK